MQNFVQNEKGKSQKFREDVVKKKKKNRNKTCDSNILNTNNMEKILQIYRAGKYLKCPLTSSAHIHYFFFIQCK